MSAYRRGVRMYGWIDGQRSHHNRRSQAVNARRRPPRVVVVVLFLARSISPPCLWAMPMGILGYDPPQHRIPFRPFPACHRSQPEKKKDISVGRKLLFIIYLVPVQKIDRY